MYIYIYQQNKEKYNQATIFNSTKSKAAFLCMQFVDISGS